MEIEKVYPAGWKVTVDDYETFYVGEYGQFGCNCNDGVIYKDQNAFETSKGVCYVNEYGFDNWYKNSGQLFEFNAKEAVASAIEDNDYVTCDGYTRRDLEKICEGTSIDVTDLFDHLDWQCPETLVDEWLDDEEECM